MNTVEILEQLKEEIDWDFRETYIGRLYDEDEPYTEMKAYVAGEVLDELHRWLTKYIDDLEDYEEI